jgi:hypothetical protein
MSFRLLVCGGRDYTDVQNVFRVLQHIDMKRAITSLAHGAARGADSIAEQWGKRTGKLTIAFPADWSLYGNRAGPVRNERMLREFKPDLVVAFPGGRGTAHMISIARNNGTPVFEVT